MNTHADKTQENKSQSVAANSSQMQSGDESSFQFVDNRPEAVAQRKLQEMANNSPRVSQLKAFQEMANNSPQAKQAAQLQAMADNYSAQQQNPIQKKENNTGLPDNLKSGIENLSGYSMDDVKVHRNSDKPTQLQAHAYAQGTDIHLASGQEKHLPHEAWHVVQQKQGRVKPTMQMKGKAALNDEKFLESEADQMGKIASQFNEGAVVQGKLLQTDSTGQVLQRVIRISGEDGNIDITNMQELRAVMEDPMSPFDDEGMIRAIFKDYIHKESTMEFESLKQMYTFGQGLLNALNEGRDSITDQELVRSYGMSPATHPGSGKKNGYYLDPVHETRPEMEDITNQEYFYRAMSREEAMTWLNPPGILLGDTGQPWASYAGYSRTYLNDTNTILVEIYAPGWLEKATSIGLLGGKPESRVEGDMSFGTGAKSESSTRGDKDSNKRRKAEFNEEGLMPIQEGRKAVKRHERSETLMLSSIYFRECAVSAKPIRILS
jgi:hypothetical protein